MGYSGFYPADGDQPEDMAADLDAKLIAPYLIAFFKKPLPEGKVTRRYVGQRGPKRVTAKWLKASDSRWERLGLVQVLNERRVGIPVSVAKKCLADLKAVQQDDAWLAQWKRHPSCDIRDTLMAAIDHISGVLERDAARQKAMKKSRRGGRRPPRQRGVRLIYDPLFRTPPGERRLVSGLLPAGFKAMRAKNPQWPLPGCMPIQNPPRRRTRQEAPS